MCLLQNKLHYKLCFEHTDASKANWVTCLLEPLPLAFLWRLAEGTGGGRIWPDGGPILASNLWDDTPPKRESALWTLNYFVEKKEKCLWDQLIGLTTHFALYRQLCVFAATLWTEVSPERQTWTSAAVLMTGTHTHTQWPNGGRGPPLYSPAGQTLSATYAILNEGLVSWSVTEALLCWGKPKQTGKSKLGAVGIGKCCAFVLRA